MPVLFISTVCTLPVFMASAAAIAADCADTINTGLYGWNHRQYDWRRDKRERASSYILLPLGWWNDRIWGRGHRPISTFPSFLLCTYHLFTVTVGSCVSPCAAFTVIGNPTSLFAACTFYAFSNIIETTNGCPRYIRFDRITHACFVAILAGSESVLWNLLISQI